MDSNDADFSTRKSRDRSINSIRSFDTTECFFEKCRKAPSKLNVCPDVQSAVMVHRSKKRSTRKTDKIEDGGANVGNKREKTGRIALDDIMPSEHLEKNDSLYINCDTLKSMHMEYIVNEDSLLSYGYNGFVAHNKSRNCFHSMHLNGKHRVEQDSCSFSRKAPCVEKQGSSIFCKRNVGRSICRETSVFAEHTSSNEAHMNAPPFLCNVCMRHFKRLSSLKLHIFSHIYHVDIFECPMIGCCRGFKDLPGTKDHIRLAHSTYEDVLVAIAKDQRWSYNFKCFLALNDFYVLTKQEDKDVFRTAFCFECFTFPVSLEMHPCSRKYSSISFCPACSLAVSPGTLRKHCLGSECKRKVPIIKRIF